MPATKISRGGVKKVVLLRPARPMFTLNGQKAPKQAHWLRRHQ
jgi:hypothetical protein